MALLTSYLSKNAVAYENNINSKKRALQRLSELLTHEQDDWLKVVYEGLLKREKIGSTALGRGVAVPHARIEGISKPVVAVMHISEPIDFDAPDDLPVHTLIGLVIPDENNETHLKLLQQIASIMHDKHQYQQICHATDCDTLYQAFLIAAATHDFT